MRVTQGCALKTYLLATVGVAAIAAAGPASAAKNAPAPIPVEMWSWSGVYFGGHGGYGWGRNPFSDDIFNGKTPPLTDISAKGGFGGFQAGANWQSGAWVGGLELDLSATSIQGSTSTNRTSPFGLGTTLTDVVTRSDKFDALGSARARLGFLPVPNVLVYGTAGPAWTRLVETTDAKFLISSAMGFVTSEETLATPTWRLGVAAGAGVETRLGDSNWLGRLEYLHYDFGKSASSVESDGLGTVTSGNVTLDVVRAGLTYKLGLGLAGSGGPALAQAMPVKALPVKALPSAPWTWSGFYIGGHAGYGWGRDPFFTVNNDLTQTIVFDDGVSSSGFAGGLQAGANWQAGAWLGGLELDLSGTGIRGSTSVSVPITAVGTTGIDTVTMSDKFELLGSARARVGRLLWPDVLFYGTGGLAWTRMLQATDEVEAITAGGTSFASSSTAVNWEFGWAAGAGVEARLWNSNWLGRIEYLHYDFGNSGSSFDSTGVTFNSGHLTTDVVRGALSYKFDWSNPAAAPTRVAMPVKARPLVLAADWSGFYLGGHAGGGWAHDPVSDSDFGFNNVLLDQTIDGTGFVGGFQAGANWQLGSFVGGLEIDASATGIKGSSTDIPVGTPFLTETDTDKFDMLGTTRIRAGYLALPNVLLYGTGGLAWTRVEQSVLDVPTGGAPNGSTTPVWEFGWAAGGGGETRLWDSNWFLRAEYLHYDFGDSGSLVETMSSGPPTLTINATHTSGHLTVDVVRSGLSYKLN